MPRIPYLSRQGSASDTPAGGAPMPRIRYPIRQRSASHTSAGGATHPIPQQAGLPRPALKLFTPPLVPGE